MQGAPWSRRIVAAHKPTSFAAVAIFIHSTKGNMQHAFILFLEIFINKSVSGSDLIS